MTYFKFISNTLLVLVILIAFLLLNCATGRNKNEAQGEIPSKVYIEIVTIPEVAQIYGEGNYLGESPLKIWMDGTSLSQISDTTIRTSPITLKWVSGETLVDTPIINFKQFSDDVQIRYERPSTFQNAEIDYNYGLNKRQIDMLDENLNGIKNSLRNTENKQK